MPIGSDAWLWAGTGREGDVYLGVAPENVDDYLKALRARDGIGLFNLTMSNKAVRVLEATPVRVIDRIVEAGYTTLTRVRIVTGVKAPQAGWIFDPWVVASLPPEIESR